MSTKLLSIFILILLNNNLLIAQEKVKEGKATFKYEYPDEDKASEKVLKNLPKYSTYYFKNGLTRVEYDDSSNICLLRPKEQERYLLKGRHAFKQTFAEANKSQALFFGDTVALITKETKMIAGFNCIKAIYTYPVWEEPMRTIEIWFTTDISASNAEFTFRGIDGFILEYSYTDIVRSDNEDIDFRKKMTCIQVEKATLPDDLFKLPPNMHVFTRDDIKKVEYH